MKNRLLLPFLLPILFLTTLYADITTGLVAHYEFEGNTSDSSGNSYNLVTGGTQAYEAGTFGQAYIFNGVDNNLTFDGLPVSGDGTISYWIKDSNNTGVEMYLSTGGFDGTLRAFAFEGSAELIADTAGNTGDNITSAGTLDGAWHHIAVTFLGTTTKIYIDGIDRALDYDTVEDINISSLLNIGHEAGGFLFTGSLDDIRIYNRALTATDILELLPPKLSLKAHGGAIQINGLAIENNVSLPINSGLMNSTNFTVEWWMNIADLSAANRIGTNWGTFAFHTASAGDGGIYVGVSGATAASRFTPADLSQTATLNEWQHYVFTFNSGEGIFYKNGVLIGSKTGMQAPDGIWNQFTLNQAALTTLTSAMQVDELRVWNVTRTSQEINASMNHQLEGNESGLVAYYNFDERVGNNVVDIAGGDSNGTIDGNVTRLNFLGDGPSFDGSTSYVSVLASTPINMSGSSSLTVSAWIQTTATTGFIFETNIEGATWVNPNTSTIAVNDGLWHYVTVIKDGITNKIYIDGVLNNTVTNDVSTATTSTAPITIGRVTREAVKEYFTGNISNVSIWNKALTQNDINKTMHSSLVGSEIGLVGYWPLNEGTGTIAYDRSINTNNATITGATWVDTAPKILGDKLYTTSGLTTFNKLILENNTTTPTYAWNGGVPTSIDFNSTMGTFTHTATDINESFSIAGNHAGTEYNVTVRTINYPAVAFVYLNLNLTNVQLIDHNITNIQVIGEDGNTENFNIPNVVNIANGTNTYTVPVYNPDNNFSIRVDVNDTDYSQSYYYNFVDKHLYGSQDYNLSSDFKQEISLINSSFTIDSNLSNYIADIDFHVDFSGSTTSLAYSTLQGFISDNTNQFIENLPFQTATSIGTLAYDFNTTVKQYHKEQSVVVRLESSIANNSLLITPLLNENNASHNIGPTVIAANLVDINISINEIGPISNILIYNLNGNLKSYALLKEEFNTSAVSFTLPVVPGDYSVQAIYRDGNISSYDNATNQWIDSLIINPVFTIGADLILPVLDSNFSSLLIATTPPSSSLYVKDMYLIKNFEDLNLTFSVYDINGSDINISVEYNTSILEINSSFGPLTYVTQAEYDTSYLTVKSIADVVGTSPVKITFTNSNSLFNLVEFNVTVAPYGTKVVAGWNLLSLPVSIDLNSTLLRDTFGHDANIERLYKYNGRWSYWDSIVGYDTNGNMNKFSSLRSTEGFWLNAIADTSAVYNFEGNVTDINSSQRVYHSGWHLMGFNEDHNITDIPTIVSENNVTGIDSVDYVYRYEYINRTAHWEVHTPDVNLSASIDSTIEHTEDNVSRYDGVWVYVRKVY